MERTTKGSFKYIIEYILSQEPLVEGLDVFRPSMLPKLFSFFLVTFAA